MTTVECTTLRVFFFLNDTATTEIYTLSLHDALPIWQRLLHDERAALAEQRQRGRDLGRDVGAADDRDMLGLRDVVAQRVRVAEDRKSTRLNSSHANISYAVFCLKKKKKTGLDDTLVA